METLTGTTGLLNLLDNLRSLQSGYQEQAQLMLILAAKGSILNLEKVVSQ